MRKHRLDQVPKEARVGILALQEELELPREFSDEALDQAESLRRHPPNMDGRADRTDIEFVTIDPASSLDLDQALCVQRDGDGYLVHYAIADVGFWVEPGSPIDVEAHQRGQTLFAPGARIPMHPPALSEDAGSLLADGGARPAVLWTHRLDRRGIVLESTTSRALVRSRHKLDYASVHADYLRGTPHPSVELLPEVGEKRLLLERERGGVSLNLPEQEIVADGDAWTLTFRQLHPVERWNAQISLLTGFVAAQKQLEANVGVLRTLPPAEEKAVQRLKLQAKAIGVEWSDDVSYPEFVRQLSPNNPKELAVLMKCTFLFRGASYLALNGGTPSVAATHSALGAPYAHTTAPLRRLVDRYVLETVLALDTGEPAPMWVQEKASALPSLMEKSGLRARRYQKGVLKIAEALVLQDAVGQYLEGILVDVKPKNGKGTVQIPESAVELHVQADPERVGERIRVRVDAVDVQRGIVELTQVN